MIWHGRWGLSVKLPLTIAMAVYGVALLSGGAALIREISVMRSGFESNVKQATLYLAEQNLENVRRRDYWSIYSSLKRQLLRQPKGQPPMKFGIIIGQGGKILGHTDPVSHRLGDSLFNNEEEQYLFNMHDSPSIHYANYQDEKIILSGTPIKAGQRVLATIWLGYDAQFISQQIWDRGAWVFIIAIGWAGLGGIFGWIISRRMVRPLTKVTRAVEDVTAGRFNDVSTIKAGEHDEIGTLTAAVNTLAAVAKEKEGLEKQLRLQEKLAAIGRMVSGVAHEINNPLGGMKNALESLKLFEDDRRKREEGIRLLGSAIAHIESIVQALLIGHRRQHEEMVCDPRSLDDLFLLIRPDCEAKGIRVQWENRIQAPFPVASNAIKEILLNFFANAINAMPDGGVLVFRADEVDKAFTFQVEDTGCGMSQEHVDKIFEPFYTTRPGGVGLGLWVCIQLVDAIDGKIDVDSAEGKGSVFTLSIPKLEHQNEKERNES